MTSTAQHELDSLLPELTPQQVERILEFARFLRWEQERTEWQEFGKSQLARAYSDDEPEYTEADIKERPTP